MWASLLWFSVAGFALLLLGMKLTEFALKSWAGNRLSSWMSRATSTPFRGFLFGTAASALLQSSTAVTVLTIGFVNAGWMTLSRSFGILLGTNVGTCLTTELMSLQFHRFGGPLVLLAIAAWMLTAVGHELRVSRSDRGKPAGGILYIRYGSVAAAGLGLLFIGFGILQRMAPLLRENGYFNLLLNHAEKNAIWGLLGGAALAAAIHSSAAVIGMAMSLAGAGALPPEAGIAIVLGANVGTCFTGLVASLGGGRGGRFVALSQLGINGVGALLFLPLIPLLHSAAAALAPSDLSAQIAHAQTLFNVVSSVAALPIAYLFGRSVLAEPASPRT
ncbi:Na/Pi cotransporter family protein [Cohnella faecalis]|uniref:Na/Pi cotransporter family protein n=1 Tax=Cohnella faecalis TaxID=2315694 RepID=A0A398CY91_9BACL|nr:Na/Pi symporter [Cohnella faecalis]RIE04191.1 Na/Pi cotransporter family protein [Cohnella faecalis]